MTPERLAELRQAAFTAPASTAVGLWPEELHALLDCAEGAALYARARMSREYRDQTAADVLLLAAADRTTAPTPTSCDLSRLPAFAAPSGHGLLP